MSNQISNQVFRKQSLPWQIIEGKTIILSPENYAAHELDEMGSFIWKRIDGENSLKDISKSIVKEFDVNIQQAHKDIIDFVNQLHKLNLISN